MPYGSETSQRIESELGRLEKRQTKLEKSYNQLKARLSSPKFRSNAPDHVIEQDELKLHQMSVEKIGLAENLASLRRFKN